MNSRNFLETNFGHKNCTSQNLIDMDFNYSSGAKFCLCYSQGHPDKLERKDPTELPEEYTVRLDQLRKGEEDVKDIKAELEKRKRETEEEVATERNP